MAQLSFLGCPSRKKESCGWWYRVVGCRVLDVFATVLVIVEYGHKLHNYTDARLIVYGIKDDGICYYCSPLCPPTVP